MGAEALAVTIKTPAETGLATVLAHVGSRDPEKAMLLEATMPRMGPCKRHSNQSRSTGAATHGATVVVLLVKTSLIEARRTILAVNPAKKETSPTETKFQCHQAGGRRPVSRIRLAGSPPMG
jgi:hypothetical protein